MNKQQVYARAAQEQEQFLAAMVEAYRTMGERTIPAMALRMKTSSEDAHRITSRLREYGLIYSTYQKFEVDNGWHLTEAGWKEANAQPPIWMQWADTRKPQESTT